MAETAKAIVQHPRFAVRFFQHFVEGGPGLAEGFEERTTPARAAALQAVLLTMIDHASGAPGAKRRLTALANGPERLECALSEETESHWVDSVITGAGEVDPTLSAEVRTKIRTLIEGQANRFLELVDTP